MPVNRDIVVPGFYKSAGGRVTLDSMTVVQEVKLWNGEPGLSREQYDVDLSRAYGYIFHMSGCGGQRLIDVSGIYFVSGSPKVKEGPRSIGRLPRSSSLEE